MSIQSFPLGSVRTITIVPAVTLQSNVINWDAFRSDGNKYEILLSFGLPTGQSQWITLFEGVNYKQNPTNQEIVDRAVIILGL